MYERKNHRVRWLSFGSCGAIATQLHSIDAKVKFCESLIDEMKLNEMEFSFDVRKSDAM